MIRQRRNVQEKREFPEEKTPKVGKQDWTGACYNYFKYVILFIVILYLLVPLCLLAFPCIVEQIVFMNLVCAPLSYEKLDRPMSAWNLRGVSNFYIKSGEETLGIWHILPQDKAQLYSTDKAMNIQQIEEQLREADSLIFYHGSGLNRGRSERLNFYQAMRQNFHVITFDYRGFGDSTGWPTENGLIEDSFEIFKWLAKRVKPNAKIIFWGHSLGASISTLALHKISSEWKSGSLSQADYDKIKSLVLVGAFANLRKGAGSSTYARFFKMVSPQNLFSYILESTLTRINISLDTDKKLSELELPVLLLHAEDDMIIPVDNSENLYDKYADSSNHEKKRCKLVKFASSHKYGHDCIHRAPELMQLINQFVDDGNKDKRFDVINL